MSERPGKNIRDQYGVPAFIGRRVAYTWHPFHLADTSKRFGKITGFDQAWLIIKFDDEERGSGGRYHPTWAIEYLPVGGPDA